MALMQPLPPNDGFALSAQRGRPLFTKRLGLPEPVVLARPVELVEQDEGLAGLGA